MWVRWTADEAVAEVSDDCHRSGKPRGPPTSSGEEIAPLPSHIPSRRSRTPKRTTTGCRVQQSRVSFPLRQERTSITLLKADESNLQPFWYFAPTSLTVALSTSTASASDMFQRVAQLTEGPSAVGCKGIGNGPCGVCLTPFMSDSPKPTVDLN